MPFAWSWWRGQKLRNVPVRHPYRRRDGGLRHHVISGLVGVIVDYDGSTCSGSGFHAYGRLTGTIALVLSSSILRQPIHLF